MLIFLHALQKRSDAVSSHPSMSRMIKVNLSGRQQAKTPLQRGLADAKWMEAKVDEDEEKS